MKLAFVHDYIKEYGGAERVLETLHEIYPNAPVFTLIYAPEFLGPHRERFKNWVIIPSVLNYIPFSYNFISFYRLIAPFVFKTFDFSSFDVIFVSATGAYNPNIINKKSAKQICYFHTPPRYLYGYATAREINHSLFMRIGVYIMNHILRIIDYISSKNIDIFIANSKNVAERIKKFYRKDSIVIYPPVNTSSPGVKDTEYRKENNSEENKGKNYFLTGGRLARPKHIDLIIKVCNKWRIPLKVFGKGFAGYGESLQKIAGENVELLGELTDEVKNELIKHAKAFIFAAEDEDFGIMPVEAMSKGIPIIAYKSGGVKESVIEGKTGLFFNELTEESLITTIKKFEKMKFSKNDCMIQATKFDKKNFIEKIRKVIENV